MQFHAKIPVHIISGVLGAGKTSALRQVLSQRPAQERWAVLINEFGELGLDAALLDEDDAAVAELAGGCMCCALGPALSVTLTRLIRQYRPQRILIEPSGLGHLSGLLEALHKAPLANYLEVYPPIWLVTPAQLLSPRWQQHPLWQSMLELSGWVMLNATDLATEFHWLAWRKLQQECFPPKLGWASGEQGQFPLQWLHPSQEDLQGWRWAPLIGAEQSLEQDAVELPMAVSEEGVYQRQHPWGVSLGWLWPASTCFDWAPLLAWLQEQPVLRIKAVVHSNQGWRSYNRGESGCTIASSAYRRDSRIEIIHSAPLDAALLSAQLEAFKTG